MISPYKNHRAEVQILATYEKLLGQWHIPVEEKMIPTRYGMTHIIEAGNREGIPVILFHGVGDDAALMWLYNACAWAKEFRLIAVDTLGGPGKSVPDERYNKTFEDALWIDDIRAALQFGKVNLIGVSHGGYLAQYYNVVRHEWVERAISMASSVPDEQSESTMKTMMKIFFPEALFPTTHNVEKLLRKLAGEHAEVFTKNEAIMAHYTWLIKGFNNMAMRYHKIRKFTDEEIDRIKENTYYIIGEEDPFEKLGGKKALLRHDMNVHFFRGTGHGINHEEAEKVNELVIQILKKEKSDIRNHVINEQ